jgi:ribonuclease HI
MPETTSRAAVFAALAQGLDLDRVRARFRLSLEELQDLFQEAAQRYSELEEGIWSLYCDGASRGNPGPAGAGALLLNPQGESTAEAGEYLGETTNNVAEYRALLLGLQKARDLGVRRLRVFADSELLVRQLNGSYRVKAAHLLPLWQAAQQELRQFKTYAVSHVPREANSRADQLANRAIDRQGPTE